MQVLAHHVLPDRARRGVGRVGDHAVHGGGKNVARCHEHRRAAERHAHEIDGQLRKAFRRPVCPVDAVVALGQAEADVVALALVLRALLHIEHAALLASKKVCEQAKITVPCRAPAVKRDHEAFGMFALAEMTRKRQALAVFEQHRLRFRRGELFRGGALRLAVGLVALFARELGAALAFERLGRLTLHRNVHERPRHAVGRRAIERCRSRDEYSRLCRFFHNCDLLVSKL